MTYDDYLEKFPSAKFSEYYVAQLLEIVNNEEPHGSIGRRLFKNGKEIPFLMAGLNEFSYYKNEFNLHRGSSVVEYGCGSLRVGAHFINFLNDYNYFGLDLTRDFIDIGVGNLDRHITKTWSAKFGLIDEDFGLAVQHNADLVICSNVVYHIHPSELAKCFKDLQELTHRVGANLCFDARIVLGSPVQFGDRNWAYSYNEIISHFPNLKLSSTKPSIHQIKINNTSPMRVIFNFKR